MVESSSLARERDEQRRWRLRPGNDGIRAFDLMVGNEFLDPADIARQQEAAVMETLRFAAAKVPYYRALFDRIGVVPKAGRGLATLRRLPVLSKFDVQGNEKALCATALPRGDRLHGWFRSSGTTGRPTRVLHSAESNAFFSFLVQRQFRWFRWDPLELRAELRAHYRLPPLADGSLPLKGGETRQESWRYVGNFFETGPQIGLCATSPVERQIAWFLERRPTYLTANSSVLDHLAWAAGDRDMTGVVEGTSAITEALTPSMRARCERTFAAPVDQNYGLNEVGVVALRCAAGRYHVMAEHCFVEIVDAEGRPVAPGTAGRLVVTALRNRAMPLLRYESGDLATAVEGPCPCGRTLPAFGDLVGRFRQLANLPDGTLDRLLALRTAVRESPLSVGDIIRQYQIRQEADGSFRFLLRCSGALPEGFAEWVQAAWAEVSDAAGPSLTLQVVSEIPLSPSGKAQDFVSAFVSET